MLFHICGQSLSGKSNLKTSENKILKRKFKSKKDEITGVWRKLHNKEANAFLFFI